MWIFDRLTVRIFTIFLLTIALFLIFITAIPSLDSRNLTYLSNSELEYGNNLAHSIEQQAGKIPQNSFRWWMRFIVIMDNFQQPGQSLYIVTPNEQVITAYTQKVELIRNFRNLLGSTIQPAKKVYELQEIIGPFLINYRDEVYHLYILQKASAPQSQLANLLFDHPLLLLVATVLLSSPFLLWLSWSLAKPARRLKKAADQVAYGNIQVWPELESFGSSEFKATGKSFNHMLKELKRMQELQQRLFSDISHELRTPLTRLQLAAALIRRKQGESKEIERIESEANKLDNMIGDLLSLARQRYSSNEIRQECFIDQLCKTLIENAQFEVNQLGKKLQVITPPSHDQILCYPQALYSAIENVIRNAFRYSNYTIELRFEIRQKHLVIMIDDDGNGVPDAELTQIFRPFYRTSEARDRASGGTGLGLAIVENAIIKDNGEVYAEKSHLGGLRIVIKLPLYKSL